MSSTLISSLIGGVFIGGAAAYLGSLMISRRMALVGDALGHVALPGMGLALLFHFDPSLGALAFLAVGILLIWRLSLSSVLSLETLVGIVFVSSLAIGFLIVPQPEMLESLIGDISRLTFDTAIVSVVVSCLLVLLVRKIYSGMVLLNVSPELASVEGIGASKYELIYLSAIALIVSLGIKLAGSLLVGALVIVPPATARMISSDLSEYAVFSLVIGMISSLLGILVSAPIHVPAGPSIILVNAAFFVLALIWVRVARWRAAR